MPYAHFSLPRKQSLHLHSFNMKYVNFWWRCCRALSKLQSGPSTRVAKPLWLSSVLCHGRDAWWQGLGRSHCQGSWCPPGAHLVRVRVCFTGRKSMRMQLSSCCSLQTLALISLLSFRKGLSSLRAVALYSKIANYCQN